MTLRDEIIAEPTLHALWGLGGASLTDEPDLSPAPARPGVVIPGTGIQRWTTLGVEGGSTAAGHGDIGWKGILGGWAPLRSGVGQTDWTFECCVAPMEYTVGLPAESMANSDTTSTRTFLYPQNPLDGNGGAGISIGTNGVRVHEHRNGVLASPLVHAVALTPRVFVHLVLICEARQYRLYLGGVLVRTGLTSAQTLVNLSTHLFFDPWSGMPNSYLDEVAWYTGALSQARITAHAAAFNAQYAGTRMPLAGGSTPQIERVAGPMLVNAVSSPDAVVALPDRSPSGPMALQPQGAWEARIYTRDTKASGDMGISGRESVVYTRRPGSRFTTYPRVA